MGKVPLRPKQNKIPAQVAVSHMMTHVYLHDYDCKQILSVRDSHLSPIAEVALHKRVLTQAFRSKGKSVFLQ